jgi:hypothetical protein
VLSPTTRTADLVLKRSEYAVAWIPAYWIVDREARTLTVLALDEVLPDYNVVAVVKAGQTYRATHPFPLEIDPRSCSDLPGGPMCRAIRPESGRSVTVAREG